MGALPGPLPEHIEYTAFARPVYCYNPEQIIDCLENGD